VIVVEDDGWTLQMGQREQVMSTRESPTERVRVGVLWRGERGAPRPREDRGLGSLFEAFATRPVEVVPVPFGDERIEEVRAQLRQLDGVLVWVNPIQDGVNRKYLDELLREVAAKGVWVSAHPDVIGRMGTKEVLFETRHLGWGSDTDLYRSVDELAERLPARLARHGRLVLKQGRGNGGNGVWSVELAEPSAPATLGSPVRVREARAKDGVEERLTLGDLIRRCGPYFSWSGVLVDQEYQLRLADGLIRCYFSHGELVGFRRQWPKGLLDAGSAGRADRPSVMEGPDAPAYQLLRQRAEGEWVPGMARLLGLDLQRLPVIWDADFLYGPKDEHGEDGHVLCEINASAVWPYPPTASTTIAVNTLARVTEARRERSRRTSGR
jgi:hypothetical protein